MPVGKIWKPEWKEYDDRVSGVRVKQLTDALGHSNHAYFTHPNWLEGGRRLLFVSDRNNARDLFSLDLESGAIVQVTDAASMGPSGRRQVRCHHVAANPKRPEACFWLGSALYAVDLETFAARPLFNAPEGYVPGNVSVTADGRFAVFGVREDLSVRFRTDLNHGYVDREEVQKASPHCRIMKLPLDGGGAECAWEEKCWITHINTSPTRADLLTFCHEGIWAKVDHRIWGLDLGSGRAWKIRPLDRPGRIGHEYWLADGERVGYHGSWPTQESLDSGDFATGNCLIGCIRHDNEGHVEFAFPHTTGHTHSLDFGIIVGDGGGVIRIWENRGGQLTGPRILCEHNSYTRWQRGHAHPVFHPDGKRVLFTSNRTEYGNLYLAEAPDDIASLPEAGVA